jgi:CBS domain containing-hemolysin-like protein
VSTGPALFLSVVLLIGNAFFVGAEFALVAARRSSIEPRAAAGSRAAAATLRAMEQVSLMMAGAQLGVTLCSLGLGYLGEPAIAHLLEDPFDALGVSGDLIHPIALVIALCLIAFLHVVFGEIVPKNIALAGPDRAALFLVPPLATIVRALRPGIAALNLLANSVLRALGIEPKDEVTSAFTRDEVAGLVDESRREGLIDAEEGELLVGALKFEERDARSVLLPLDRLITVPPAITPAELETVAARAGYSRYPVRDDGRLVGYVHVKDVLEFDDERRNRPVSARWIRPLADVRTGDPLRTALATMQRARAHLGRAVDDDGALVGVVALEDVLEELVGEIRDEATRGRQVATRRRSGATRRRPT